MRVRQVAGPPLAGFQFGPVEVDPGRVAGLLSRGWLVAVDAPDPAPDVLLEEGEAEDVADPSPAVAAGPVEYVVIRDPDEP